MIVVCRDEGALKMNQKNLDKKIKSAIKHLEMLEKRYAKLEKQKAQATANPGIAIPNICSPVKT